MNNLQCLCFSLDMEERMAGNPLADDHRWVKEHVIDVLMEKGYSCCFEIKDYVAGQKLQKNLTKALNCSRRYIVVMSR